MNNEIVYRRIFDNEIKRIKLFEQYRLGLLNKESYEYSDEYLSIRSSLMSTAIVQMINRLNNDPMEDNSPVELHHKMSKEEKLNRLHLYEDYVFWFINNSQRSELFCKGTINPVVSSNYVKQVFKSIDMIGYYLMRGYDHTLVISKNNCDVIYYPYIKTLQDELITSIADCIYNNRLKRKNIKVIKEDIKELTTTVVKVKSNLEVEINKDFVLHKTKTSLNDVDPFLFNPVIRRLANILDRETKNNGKRFIEGYHLILKS